MTAKIYTSSFTNPELRSGDYTEVGIVRGLPKFRLSYRLAGNILDIAPPGYLFRVYDREEFIPPYMKHLDKIGVEKISAQIQDFQALGKDIVLCYYEDVRKPNEWCHRLVFAEWWLRETGTQGRSVKCLPDGSLKITPGSDIGRAFIVTKIFERTSIEWQHFRIKAHFFWER